MNRFADLSQQCLFEVHTSIVTHWAAVPPTRSAREIAFDILLEVERGAFAADLLAHETKPLETRDAGLAAAITLGVLRRWLSLDFLIRHYSQRDPDRVDLEVRMALSMGLYQMRWMDRVPNHAAVSESVDLVKRAGLRSAAGFTNAILRKAGREEVAWPNASVELSMPPWLLERWTRNFGAEPARAMALAALETPTTYIRVPPGRQPPEGAEPTAIAGCYQTVDTGGFRVQDIGSQSIVPLLALEPGMTFLDLCAAPGNKTAQALEAGAKTIACDLRMRRLQPLQRLGIPLVALDATRPLPFGVQFDRILLDAPCSGTGTLAHNPEIKWRLESAELDVYRRTQVALLRQALTVLKPGGRLVYSTCSLEPEENRDVLSEVCPERVQARAERLPGRDPGDGFEAAVIF
ncbi:MAG TPA: transcription antitermination factor NusB [Casimicrobiaceae bacterium]